MHKARTVRPHDRVKLDERPDQQVAHPAAGLERGIVQAVVDIDVGDDRHQHVQAQAGIADAQVRQVAQLRQGQLVVQFVPGQTQVIAVLVAQVVG